VNHHVTVEEGYNGVDKIRIGELATITDVSKRTIDYYTNIGLLEAERTSSNYRYYTAESIQTLQTIKDLKNKNMSLGEIKQFLQAQNGCTFSVDELKDKLQGLEKDITEIIELIQKEKISKDHVDLKKVSSESISLIHSLLLLLV